MRFILYFNGKKIATLINRASGLVTVRYARTQAARNFVMSSALGTLDGVFTCYQIG